MKTVHNPEFVDSQAREEIEKLRDQVKDLKTMIVATSGTAANAIASVSTLATEVEQIDKELKELEK